MKGSLKEWKACAIALSGALARCSYECNTLNHRRGEYHEIGEDCPVRKKIAEADAMFDALMKREGGAE